MKQTNISRLNDLRRLMKGVGVDAVIINKTDPHQSEYIDEHWALLKRISGFTGSNATLVVTDEKALLWTDSRYFLQAARQLEGTTIELMKEDLPGTPSISEWLTANLGAGSVVGIDGTVFGAQYTRDLRKCLNSHSITLLTDFDPVGDTWAERPSLPDNKIFLHDIKYAGVDAATKIEAVLASCTEQGAQGFLISALDEIAWVLNIRSHDIPDTTVALSFLYLSAERKVLFVNPEKLTPSVTEALNAAGVETLDYNDVYTFVKGLPGSLKVLVEPARTSIALIELLGERAIEGTSPIALMKACKNATQVAGIRAAMERDGVALVKAFMEIEKRVNEGTRITESDVCDILLTHRSAHEMFFDTSFETISCFGPHGAIVHYVPNEESNAVITVGGLLLVDSGAQYYDGTTDITRTIAVGGKPTAEQRRDFTLVMKGHIALGSAIFPAGTTGHQLDCLARQFLWKNGLNYLHGTGHGVGQFLNVHEGPQSIRLNHVPTPLMPGMVTSNEPGLYRENVHGIRCENLTLTVEKFETEFGKFLGFETLTLFPFDLTLFDTSIMTDDEIEWINNYHRMVRERLTPMLNSAERMWLELHTAKLTR